MLRIFSKQTIKKSALRFLAASVLFVWLGQLVPLHVAAKVLADVCRLSCCKDAARHAANSSCAGGKCHLKPAKKPPTDEILCGAKEAVEKKIAENRFNIFAAIAANAPEGVLLVDETQMEDSPNSERKTSIATLASPNSCQTDCCAASMSAGQQNRTFGDKAMTKAFADQPRPPTTVKSEFFSTVSVKLNSLVSGQAPSRAPPVFFS